MIVGVDVSARRGLDVVVLDGRRRLAADPLLLQEPDELATVLARWRPVVVAVDAPSQWGTTGASRGCERELRALGIRCFATPSDPAVQAKPFYDWMRTGLAVFAVAGEAGYPVYEGGEDPAGHALEAFPHGTAVVIRGEPMPAGTVRRLAEKRAWRQAALARAGVDDPRLRTLDQVDAALAAVAGHRALGKEALVVGGRPDGVIVL